jgi:hypothetical protein
VTKELPEGSCGSPQGFVSVTTPEAPAPPAFSVTV